jgi:hypothetical protein
VHSTVGEISPLDFPDFPDSFPLALAFNKKS